jgi:hypothetical protein
MQLEAQAGQIAELKQRLGKGSPMNNVRFGIHDL